MPLNRRFLSYQLTRWSTSKSGAGCNAVSQTDLTLTSSPTCALPQPFHNDDPRTGAGLGLPQAGQRGGTTPHPAAVRRGTDRVVAQAGRAGATGQLGPGLQRRRRVG